MAKKTTLASSSYTPRDLDEEEEIKGLEENIFDVTSVHEVTGPFLATSNTLIDVQKGELTMGFKDEHMTFNVFNSIKSPKENENFLKAELIDLG
ncbi:DNA-directed DNA polymerase [Senna tora]|uniref:DNA-directed DNA polymerase n=1 Tax=Senna tora TaxID=362788 RepID=A0A834T1T5_9FABA|nr:DNA-directed DNA polymerase [Senna tora]